MSAIWILERVLGAVQGIIVAFFYKNVLEAKNKSVLPIMTILLYIMIVLRGTFPVSSILETFAIHIVHFLFVILGFKDKISKRLISFILYFLLSFVCDFLTFTLTGSMGIKNEFVFVIVRSLLMSSLLYLLLGIAAKYIENFSKIADKKIYSAFILIPVNQFGFLTLTVYLMNSIGLVTERGSGISSQSISIALSVLLLFTLIADFVFLKVTYSATENIKNKEKLRSLEEQSKLNYKYYQDLQMNTEKMKKYRHDTNNILQSIYTILETPDNSSTEKAKELAENLENEINSINLKRYCSHPIINAVLADKESAILNKNIKCNFNASVPEDTTVSSFDLCRIFSNLLDNAKEACENLNNAEINLDASIIDGYLYIKLLNPFDSSNEKVKNSERGNGLKIIKQISEKYNGELITSIENNVFETLVTLKV